MHISTGYVFDGKKQSYTENDTSDPLSAYGLSRLAGEFYVQNILDKYFIVRTLGLYNINKCRAKGENFVDLMLDYARKKMK